MCLDDVFSPQIFSSFLHPCISVYRYRLTFVWISFAMAIHDLHLRNADVKFLKPLIKFAAGLSPHPRISVPLRCTVCPSTINGTPSLYEITCTVNIHASACIQRCMHGYLQFPVLLCLTWRVLIFCVLSHGAFVISEFQLQQLIELHED